MKKDWNKINDLKYKSIYALILSYPNQGIPRAEKHHLVEWLMEQRNEDIFEKEKEGADE